MINDMTSQGFMKINFKIFNISDIGIKRIKSLDHGMRLSMKNFFKEHLKENNDFKCSAITESTYTAVDHIYKFKNLNSLIELEIAKAHTRNKNYDKKKWKGPYNRC